MNTPDIKSELKELIDQEADINVLEAIKTLLKKASLNPVLQEKLTSRALKAHQDIKEGRTMSREEIEKKLDAQKRICKLSKHIIRLHKPHPGNILKMYVIDYVIGELKDQGLIGKIFQGIRIL